jgi:hypothetical protein
MKVKEQLQEAISLEPRTSSKHIVSRHCFFLKDGVEKSKLSPGDSCSINWKIEDGLLIAESIKFETRDGKTIEKNIKFQGKKLQKWLRNNTEQNPITFFISKKA